MQSVLGGGFGQECGQGLCVCDFQVGRRMEGFFFITSRYLRLSLCCLFSFVFVLLIFRDLDVFRVIFVLLGLIFFRNVRVYQIFRDVRGFWVLDCLVVYLLVWTFMCVFLFYCFCMLGILVLESFCLFFQVSCYLLGC